VKYTTIIKEISKNESQRRLRFKAAQELYALLVENEDEAAPEVHEEIQRLEGRMGMGWNAGTYHTASGAEKQPCRLYAYGLEKLYYRPGIISNVLAFNKALDEWNGPNPITKEQWGAARKHLKLPGLILGQKDRLTLDYSKSPFIKDLLFLCVALYRPFFSRQVDQYPTNNFIWKKIANTNPNHGFKKTLTATIIRGRLKGNNNYLKKMEKRLQINKLVSNELYEYLVTNNGHMRPKSTYFL